MVKKWDTFPRPLEPSETPQDSWHPPGSQVPLRPLLTSGTPKTLETQRISLESPWDHPYSSGCHAWKEFFKNNSKFFIIQKLQLLNNEIFPTQHFWLVNVSRLSQYKLQKLIQNLVKHLRWIFLRKSLMGTKANSKPCQTSEMELYRKLLPATETNSEFAKHLWQSFWVSIDYD